MVPLESPHNSIHLAVGGFDVPKATTRSPIEGANGDMGENDTAGLDPIFFFHHCFVDRVFWLWQKRHGATDHLDIIAQYPGTNSVDNQGPTPGVRPEFLADPGLAAGSVPQGWTRQPYTSRDCINIETQLGYTYGPGSLEDQPALLAGRPRSAEPVHARVTSRASIAARSAVRSWSRPSPVIDGKNSTWAPRRC